jgi:excisionase family DNA binding protein
MPHRAFSLEEVANYLHLNVPDVEELVKYHEIPFVMRGGRAVFQRGEIDAWASQRILGLPENRLAIYHQRAGDGPRLRDAR